MHQLTRVVRVDLNTGAFDALNAVHFVQRFSPHFHDTFAIGVVEEGWAHLRTRRGEWQGGPGTILAFSPGEVHSAVPMTSAGYSYRMVYPPRPFMEALGLGGVTTLSSPVIHDERVATALCEAHVPLMEKPETRRSESRLLDALRMLVRSHVVNTDAQSNADPDFVVKRAQAVLNEQFTRRFTLAELAHACGASRFQLIRRFRRVLGTTPFAYLAQVRVNRAQAMLCQGGALSEVAYACGFSDQSHLTRAFKQAFGIPPGEYVRAVSCGRS